MKVCVCFFVFIYQFYEKKEQIFFKSRLKSEFL